MIASITGTLESRGVDHAIVDVGGFGFRVFVPSTTAAALGPIGDRVRLFTMLYVRQEQLALYGFRSAEDLRLFELLLGVSGVGPKAALAVLSGVPVDVLRSAVTSGNADLLGRVPGIGKKTAARIVVDLKDKLGSLPEVTVAGAPDRDGDLLSALTGLGYSPVEARAAIQSIPDGEASIEERIVHALRFLGSR